MRQRPKVDITVNWDDDTYAESSEDLINYLKKDLELDIVSASVFEDVMDIFLSCDLEKIKKIEYGK